MLAAEVAFEQTALRLNVPTTLRSVDDSRGEKRFEPTTADTSNLTSLFSSVRINNESDRLLSDLFRMVV
jgi:hypothetical protein